MFSAEIKESGRLEIVDGSQRIRTLAAFMNDELTLSHLGFIEDEWMQIFKDFSWFTAII